MVIMEKPSPIQVGREFVRQYYTLLNKAPELLYRFYSVHSSYVHGGKYCEGETEMPVIGQTEIHKKIDSLNFSDCHTKIRQVDAHSTIGSGVVIQVIGELSNCGQPLRRFMQTFVLAPQGDNPFKFYVHNDIFRYQDEVFHDDGQVERSDDEQELENEPNDAAPQPSNLINSTQDNHCNEADMAQGSPQTNTAATDAIEQQHGATTPELHDEPVIPEKPVVSTQRSTPQTEPEPTEPTSHISEPPSAESSTEPPLLSDKPETTVDTKPAAMKPRSWADMISRNTSSVGTNTPATVIKANKPPVEQQPPPTEAPSRQPTAPRNNQNYQREEDRGDRNYGYPRRSGDGNANPGMGREQQSGIRYPDNQQIFVGNLPSDVVKSELEEHFAGFGNILEVKISLSHTHTPHFGFIIFEDPKSAEEVLRVMPTQYRNNHRINIEEKKQRSRDNMRRVGGESYRGGMAGDNRGGRRGPPNARRDRQGPREEGSRPNYNYGNRR